MKDNYVLAFLYGDDGRGASYALLRVDDTLLENMETCRLAAVSMNGGEGTKPTGTSIVIRSTGGYSMRLYASLPAWLEAGMLGTADPNTWDGQPVLLRDLDIPVDDEPVPADYMLCGIAVYPHQCEMIAHVKHEDGENYSNDITEAVTSIAPKRHVRKIESTS